jgi:hypothetical protein
VANPGLFSAGNLVRNFRCKSKFHDVFSGLRSDCLLVSIEIYHAYKGAGPTYESGTGLAKTLSDDLRRPDTFGTESVNEDLIEVIHLLGLHETIGRDRKTRQYQLFSFP